ncbi:kinase-like domain-containing protein [Suillus subluteus]|nr:kinase-like domain-containing protein [Suillus subluteus]
MDDRASVFQRPQRQTQIIENGNGNSVANTAASADSTTRPKSTIVAPGVVPVPASNITTLQPDASIQTSAPQVQVQFDLPILSSTMDENFAPQVFHAGLGYKALSHEITVDYNRLPLVHMKHSLAFDADPLAIPSTSIRKQTDYPTSCGGLGDIWKCSMIIDPVTPATSTEVAVKTIRVEDILNKEAVQKAKKRLRHEVAVWIRLRHAHVLTLHGTVSGFGPLPALVSTWMDNGALNGYLKRTSLAMEQKLKLLKQVVDGLSYLHEQEVIHGDLTSANIVIDRDGNAFLADFGLSVALAESDRSYYNTYSSGAIRWLAPELIGSPNDSNSDVDFPKPSSQSDVFSLGCIMLHVISGRPPFWWLRNVQRRIGAQFKHVEPYKVEPGVTVSHQHLDFMRKCWSAKPEDRPSTGDAASFGRASGTVTILQPVTFDTDPFAIPSISIKRQTDYPTSSGGLGDTWKCSMIIDQATSTEVAVKSIRIADMRDEEAIKKAKKRLRCEVAVWIRLRHAHVLTLHGTVSGFGPLPALVSTWMDNGALNGYLERTSLTMEQKLKLLKQVVDGLRYLHEQGVIHGDLTSTNVVIDRDGNAFLADFGLSVALAESDQSYYHSYSKGAVRWSAPELIFSLEPESIPDDSNNGIDFPKPNSQSDVFSLGCIMLHVFSGRPPFWWLKNVTQIFSARSKSVEPYRVEPSVTVSHQHLDFFQKCWSAKPENRPSIGDVASFVEYELASFIYLFYTSSNFFTRDVQLDLESPLLRLDSKATTVAMAMASVVMTRPVLLVAQQTHHLRLICAICSVSCAPAFDLQMRPYQFTSSPGV